VIGLHGNRLALLGAEHRGTAAVAGYEGQIVLPLAGGTPNVSHRRQQCGAEGLLHGHKIPNGQIPIGHHKATLGGGFAQLQTVGDEGHLGMRFETELELIGHHIRRLLIE